MTDQPGLFDPPAETISCSRACDAQEDGIANALAAGWEDIVQDFDGLSWNYLGTCPACAADERNR